MATQKSQLASQSRLRDLLSISKVPNELSNELNLAANQSDDQLRSEMAAFNCLNGEQSVYKKPPQKVRLEQAPVASNLTTESNHWIK